MIFIGYSSQDRYTVVEPILFHLQKYGFKVWYDFDDMFLGDNRKIENFEKGIAGADYIIFIISHSFFESPCAKEELDYAYELVNKKGYILFSIFYKFLPSELPEDYCWLRTYIFNEIKIDTGTRYATDQIVERMVHDTLLKKRFQSFDALTSLPELEGYTKDLLLELNSVDIRNYGIRSGILYALYVYLRNIRKEKQEANCEKAIIYILNQSQFPLHDNHLIYSILEKSVILFINHLFYD